MKEDEGEDDGSVFADEGIIPAERHVPTNFDKRGRGGQGTSGPIVRETLGGGGDEQQQYNNGDGDLGSGIVGKVVILFSWLLVITTLPFSLFFCLKVVQQYERVVIFRMGRIKPGSTHGIFFILPCIENYRKVDTRSNVFDLPTQEVLTKDSVTVSVDAVLYYRISNAVMSITKVANAHASARLLAQTTLRGVLGQRNLQDLLADRDAISAAMANAFASGTNNWGINVERVEITDVHLPKQLQRAMAAEGEAVREAKAKSIAAEGEHKAARALMEASEILMESPAAIQLRHLQTLTTIAAENNKTIIFPLPIQLIAQLMQGYQVKNHN